MYEAHSVVRMDMMCDVWCGVHVRIDNRSSSIKLTPNRTIEFGRYMLVLHHQNVCVRDVYDTTMPSIIRNNNYHNKIELSIYYGDQKACTQLIMHRVAREKSQVHGKSFCMAWKRDPFTDNNLNTSFISAAENENGNGNDSYNKW